MTRLFIQLRTVSGSRTIISNEVSNQDAAEIAHSLATVGIPSYVHGDVAPVDMKAIVRRKKLADAKAASKASKPIPTNVTPMPVRKKN